MIGSTKARLLGLLAALALAAAAVLAAAAAPASAATTTCQDGFLPPGTYGAVVVPADSFCFSDGGIMIGGGVTVGAGGTFALASEESPGPLSSIYGGVNATNPANVQIHFTTIIGNVNIQGGSSPFGGPFGITWNTIEDSKIIGTTTINGYDGFWMGFIRNHTIGSVNMTNNVLLDEDGNEYVSNSIHGNLNCSGNDPAPQVGDSEGSPNLVYGFETGQCFGL
jgi:hypothetical protein